MTRALGELNTVRDQAIELDKHLNSARACLDSLVTATGSAWAEVTVFTDDWTPTVENVQALPESVKQWAQSLIDSALQGNQDLNEARRVLQQKEEALVRLKEESEDRAQAIREAVRPFGFDNFAPLEAVRVVCQELRKRMDEVNVFHDNVPRVIEMLRAIVSDTETRGIESGLPHVASLARQCVELLMSNVSSRRRCCFTPCGKDAICEVLVGNAATAACREHMAEVTAEATARGKQSMVIPIKPWEKVPRG